MANLPSKHPHLSLHLTDRALTPLITSSRSQSQLSSLTSLTSTSLTAHETVLRLGLGTPQRIMVEHGNGPVLLQTYITPQPQPQPPPSSHEQSTTNPTDEDPEPSQAAAHLASLSLSPSENQPSNSTHQGALSLAAESRLGADLSTSTLRDGAEAEEPHTLFLDSPTGTEDESSPPMLVGIVVAPSSDEALDARRAAAKLDRVGREIQERWGEVMGGGGEH
ncbi:hypothetical protein GGR57DRAFT_486274 [Xylariaceae sp. FL1272]|nr:hypothetical protein GGR57DRAFT_486274 [Xylariaceae sp. FL1272]